MKVRIELERSREYRRGRWALREQGGNQVSLRRYNPDGTHNAIVIFWGRYR